MTEGFEEWSQPHGFLHAMAASNVFCLGAGCCNGWLLFGAPGTRPGQGWKHNRTLSYEHPCMHPSPSLPILWLDLGSSMPSSCSKKLPPRDFHGEKPFDVIWCIFQSKDVPYPVRPEWTHTCHWSISVHAIYARFLCKALATTHTLCQMIFLTEFICSEKQVWRDYFTTCWHLITRNQVPDLVSHRDLISSHKANFQQISWLCITGHHG